MAPTTDASKARAQAPRPTRAAGAGGWGGENLPLTGLRSWRTRSRDCPRHTPSARIDAPPPQGDNGPVLVNTRGALDAGGQEGRPGYRATRAAPAGRSGV